VWDDWHDYVRTLELPTCAPGTTLVITSTDSVLDGGPGITSLAEAGATLSFVEALWWSQNIGGPFTIRFDPTVFTDVATPHILLDASQQNWPETIASTCIDGRNATVVIEVINPRDPLAMCSDHCGNFTLDHSQLIGVTWLTPYESRNLFGWHLAIMNGSQVAGCRLGTDGLTNTSPATYGSFQLGGATLGPGNAIGGGTWAVAASGAFALVGNYLGYDPVTRTSLSVYIAARIQGPGLVADNVFLANDIQCWVSDPLNATVRNNWFGRNPTGTTVEPSSTGVSSSNIVVAAGNGVIGPDNKFIGTTRAIDVVGPVHITRNVITGNTALGIGVSGDSPSPPTITAATTGLITGTCTVPGTLELFSDPGDQGEQYLGSTTCDAINPWTLVTSVPRERNVTATLTDLSNATSTFSAPFAVP